jgi:heptosyltransferase-2
LGRERFDAAVLLPNSFRSAALARLAGIPRRIGYDRDGRGWLLTDRPLPLRTPGRFVPVPAIDYDLGLARYLGAERPDRRVELFTRDRDERRADRLLRDAGVAGGGSASGPRVLLNPGAANHGDAKLWPADRFAAVADALIERHGATVLVNGAPSERAVLDAVHAAARHPLIDLPGRGGTLPTLKGIARRCDLVIGNDSGARHIAAAMGTPTISLFGPTEPEWTRLDLPHERVIASPDGRMSGIGTDEVIEAAEAMLSDVRLQTEN